MLCTQMYQTNPPPNSAVGQAMRTYRSNGQEMYTKFPRLPGLAQGQPIPAGNRLGVGDSWQYPTNHNKGYKVY